MRKFLITLLTIIMMVSLSLLIACGKTDSSNGGNENSQNSSVINPPISNSSDTSSDSGNNDDQPTDELLTVAQVKSAIDNSPNGVEVEFEGVVVGFDSMGYAHVGDSTGIIYVRAKHTKLIKGAHVKIKGVGYAYKGSASYPEYTRQIKDTGIIVEDASGSKPTVKPAVTLTAQNLLTTSESTDKSKSFHGNLVTLTGTVSVGDTKFAYYLLDDVGNRMVGLHHYSLHFANSIEDSVNKFNALNGKKITIEGVIYRYYTAENIWTFQYINDNLQYTLVDENQGGNEQPTICSVCGMAITNSADHAPIACGHTVCASGNHETCTYCGEYLCNGEEHLHNSGDNEQTEGVVNGVYYELSNDKTYAIAQYLDYNDNRQVVEVLSELNGLPVKKIGIFERAELLKVIIPSSVEELDYNAFSRCTNLNEVVIAENSKLKTINSDVFANTKITQITLPSTLKSVGVRAFKNCEQLEKVYYQGDINSWAQINFASEYSNPMTMASEIYFNNVLFTSNLLNIPSSVQVIGSYAFDNFKGITEIVLPSTLTQIGYGAFKDCTSLAKITMPCITAPNFTSSGTNSQIESFFGGFGKVPANLRTVTIIGSTTIPEAYFRGCKYITTVNIPDDVTRIGCCAFDGCSALESIDLPSSLIHIEYYAFKSTGLTSVKIPFATRYIESQAFFTSTLKTLYIHSQIEELSSTAFYSSITTVYFTGKSTWEQMIALNSAYNYISGTKTYVSTYSLD